MYSLELMGVNALTFSACVIGRAIFLTRTRSGARFGHSVPVLQLPGHLRANRPILSEMMPEGAEVQKLFASLQYFSG